MLTRLDFKDIAQRGATQREDVKRLLRVIAADRHTARDKDIDEARIDELFGSTAQGL